MIIDTHTHLFSSDTTQYPLANPQSSYRPEADGSVEYLKAQMAVAGVDRALTITPAFYGWDNNYSFTALKGNAAWLAVGVLVDPQSPQACQALTSYVSLGASGVRIQGCIQNQPRLDDPLTTPLWQQAADLELTIDINATHDEYPQVEQRLQQFPHTPMILDHCGYIAPNLAPLDNNIEPLLRLARYPNAYAKLSFASIASRQQYPFTDVHHLFLKIIEVFGPERCLYGSNFPTAQYCPQMTYTQTVEFFRSALELAPKTRAWILGNTAAALWKWQSL